MAGRSHKKNKKPGRMGKTALGVFAGLLLLLAMLAGISVINTDVVRIRRAEVMLPDLPEPFDGVKLLYASDIDLCGMNTPEKSGKLFRQLQSLEPDLLLLGGDYTASTVIEILNRNGNSAPEPPEYSAKRESFFHYISSFEAPLGKYAIASPEDPDWDNLVNQLKENGILPLINGRMALEREGEKIWLAGLCQESASLNSAGNTFDNEDCVIVVAYGPAVLPILLTSEAANGGQWADLVLCGHTHGGQIRLFGRSILSLSDTERRYLSGWQQENGLPVLTTSGVGCEGANLRLGTSPEVWLITLKAT